MPDAQKTDILVDGTPVLLTVSEGACVTRQTTKSANRPKPFGGG